MARTVKMIMVAIGADASSGASQNNKFYDMFDTEDGKFRAEYGRVGTSPQKRVYPIGQWQEKYNEKLKKGYKDISGLYVENTSSSTEFLDIPDLQIKLLISRLQAYAKKEVATFYNISADKVTQKQVDEAQSILNSLLTAKDSDTSNKILIELYKVIPRKMNDVRVHLIGDFKQFDLDRIIAKEQALLDTMAGQVKQAELIKENIDSDLTILDAMGLSMANITSDEESIVKSKLGEIKHMYSNAFKVTNKRTQKIFDDFVSASENKKTELFFHGSRNENWISILETGLILRPTNAVISGKMFGYGTYFADKAKKSLGYTSSRGSYWAKGSSDEAYMSLFDVHLGNPLHVKRRESWMGSLNEAQLKAKGQYDSLFAEGGIDLVNNEYIIYREEQSTVKFLIQLKG